MISIDRIIREREILRFSQDILPDVVNEFKFEGSKESRTTFLKVCVPSVRKMIPLIYDMVGERLPEENVVSHMKNVVYNIFVELQNHPCQMEDFSSRAAFKWIKEETESYIKYVLSFR